MFFVCSIGRRFLCLIDVKRRFSTASTEQAIRQMKSTERNHREIAAIVQRRRTKRTNAEKSVQRVLARWIWFEPRQVAFIVLWRPCTCVGARVVIAKRNFESRVRKRASAGRKENARKTFSCPYGRDWIDSIQSLVLISHLCVFHTNPQYQERIVHPKEEIQIQINEPRRTALVFSAASCIFCFVNGPRALCFLLYVKLCRASILVKAHHKKIKTKGKANTDNKEKQR